MKFRKEKNQGHNPYLKAAVLEMSRISSKRMILQKQETYSIASPRRGLLRLTMT